jgi:flagellin
MSLSIQTNMASLVSQNDLLTNTNFQNQTIQELSSGYRINSAADDPAGLAAANEFRNSEAQLTQGIANANDGVSTLQIVDGGLTNISNILNRLQTLATESASQTFTGNRSTINNEYQNLLSEIDRQASNIGLSGTTTGNANNTNMSVYIGGGSIQANSQVQIDLSGAQNQVDSAGLGLAGTNVSAGGTELTGGAPNVINLNNANGDFTGNQSFTFNIENAQGQAQVETVSTGENNATAAGAIANLNAQLSIQAPGITASIAKDGTLQFAGSIAFSVLAGTPTGGDNGGTGGGLATTGSAADSNAGMYSYVQPTANFVGLTNTEVDQVTNSQGTVNVTLNATNADTTAHAISAINTQLNSIGIYAVANSVGTGFTLQSDTAFTLDKTTADTNGTGNVFGTAATTGAIGLTNAAPTTPSSSADTAITAITNAVSQLGLVQGRVGAGENQLNYAISLATSQVTNFTSAESQIRDANVAQQAANLTKAQVLQQASIAAMAQANSAPQQYLALLKA